MRMLALVTDAFGGFGGISQYNRDFLTACAEANSNNSIWVLTRATKENVSFLPPNLVQVKPRANKILYAFTALSLLKKNGPFDVIFCGHIFMVPLAALLSKWSGSRLWLQLHGVEAWCMPSSLQRWATEQADLVTAVSRYTRHKFLNWANLDTERVRVLPNTVQTRFQPLPKQLGLENKKILLTVGRLSSTERYKGHDRVIKVLPELLTKYSNLVYVIAGDGDDRHRLEDLTKHYGVSSNVDFIGKVPDEELPELYRMADVFVMPSTGEGFGIVFLEAAASGMQVIGGNRDGSIDALADGKVGFAIDPDNRQELLFSIHKALTQPKNTNNYVANFSYPYFSGLVKRLIENLNCHKHQTYCVVANTATSQKKEL
jgi:phosphatidylinositol alpha-1,6-mannosyltransferase